MSHAPRAQLRDDLPPRHWYRDRGIGTRTGVSTAAESTTQALTRTRTSVHELSQMAADLRAGVSRFTY